MIPGQGLEFSNLSYSVPKQQKKDGATITKEVYLLNDLSGQAVRGEIMAILGPSGAGKSTFLDALAGRIARGSLEGSVKINGKPVSASYMKMVSSYVMQDDQLFAMLTVFETLMFAAEVRLPLQFPDQRRENEFSSSLINWAYRVQPIHISAMKADGECPVESGGEYL
ncbi:ABC transporter G family member 16 [Vitis vinifera]|uniref:ABC transporter G family member 16 n=1 Tax=Vitis vinifera TaxID=29760 RepID=A0A438K9R8_VITVI|nr:ABC transporter G family member 16 [Vitis vinifera]